MFGVAECELPKKMFDVKRKMGTETSVRSHDGYLRILIFILLLINILNADA